MVYLSMVDIDMDINDKLTHGLDMSECIQLSQNEWNKIIEGALASAYIPHNCHFA